MRSLAAALLALLFTACAMTPSKPPLPKGEYRPVNAPTERNSSTVTRATE